MAILNPFFAKRPVTMVRCLISKADASNLSIANILVFYGGHKHHTARRL
ncbi:hypothetical protein D052_0342 [Vibrio parahaemolyticus 10290]|nr:hypothetical protein D052_0342 [Vibrio parahaemolyticus 10290]